MKTVFIALLLVAVVLGARTTSSKLQQKRISELAETRLGKTLLNLITLHSAVAGPVQELIDAIQELIDDLNASLEELEFNFNVRTNEHNSLVISLEMDIQGAETDVARAEDLIDSLLVPRRNQIQTKINNLEENIAYNRKTLAEETLLREQAHEAYETQIAEYNDATESVDEALNLLNSLGNPSLIQLKKFSSYMQKVQKKKVWNKIKSGPMLAALLSLASSQNFSDQGLLQEIVNQLQEFRAQVVDAINELTAQENEAVVEYEERVEQLEAEKNEFQSQIAAASLDLNATVDKINETQNFRDQREQDRRTYVAQLELENETYANEVDIYTNLKNEYLRELAASEQGLSVVTSHDFGSSVNLGKF